MLDVRGRLRAIQAFTDDRMAVSNAIAMATENNTQHLETTGNHDVNITVDHAEDARKKHVAEEEKELIAMARTGADSTGKHLSVTERAYAQTLFAALQESQKTHPGQARIREPRRAARAGPLAAEARRAQGNHLLHSQHGDGLRCQGRG